jgi:AcrR family transcriptional regulator
MGTHTSASVWTATFSCIMDAACPATRSCPVGWSAIVIMVPAIPVINAIPLLRSSVMSVTLKLNRSAVKMLCPEKPSYGTNRQPMSGKKPRAKSTRAEKSGTKSPSKLKRKPGTDRRTLQTRDALGDALVELMHERPFKSITVQDVLDRAGVGRSTFYTHFRDKDDLFISDVEEFWEMMSSMLDRSGESSMRVAPVRELFSHIADAKVFRDALVAAGKMHDVMELGQGQFARAIEKRLVKLTSGQGLVPAQLSPTAHALAGALFSSMMWWIYRGMPAPPEEMDEAFHRLVWSGVNASAKN